MPVIIQLPGDIERQLRDADPKLDEHAREQFIIARYREEKLSTGDIALILGFETRFEAERWLGARAVNQNYSRQDLEDDRDTLERILGPVKR